MGDSGGDEEFHDAVDGDLMPVRVRVQHAMRRFNSATSNGEYEIMLKKNGSDTIYDVKEKIATAAGKVEPSSLLVEFGPNDKILGARFENDKDNIDSQLLIKKYNVLYWLEQFPNWSLTCRFLPESPPPPGEAATRAAAIAEGALDNGDAAVEENRRNGMLASA